MKRRIIQKWFVRILTLTFLSVTAISCVIIYNKREMYLADEPFYTDSISFRTDGFFYTVKDFAEGENSIYDEGKKVQSKSCAISTIIFFDDGSTEIIWAIYGHRTYSTELEKKENIELALKSFENGITARTYHGRLKDTPWDWGFYKQLDRDSLLIQSYYNWQGDYVLLDWYGSVVNDTTLFFHYWINNNQATDSKYYKNKLNQVYHFKEFHHKPDSTNYILENIEKFGRRRASR